MANRALLHWGVTPVPYAASWTDEEEFFVGMCPYYRRLAIRQKSARGSGKPKFGSPHSDRQREVIALGLCDLCAKPIKHNTKVSLSHARPQPHGVSGWAILQVEPILHRECAARCITLCPSLKRDVEQGTLMVRQVHRHRTQCAIMDEVYTQEMTGKAIKALGHAKVELIHWTDRDIAWLGTEMADA